MRTTSLLAFALTLSFTLPAAAQGDGYELTLVGNPFAYYGESYHLAGTAYEVRGLAGLRGAGGAEVTLELLDRPDRVEQVVTERSVRAENDGTFALDMEMPSRPLVRPRMRVTITQGQTKREFYQGIQLRSPLVFDVLSDRRRYEPGETAHLWLRLRRQRDGAPVDDRSVHVTVTDARGNEVLDRRIGTNAGGVAAVEVPLEEGAVEGLYRALVRVDDSVAGAQQVLTFQVARRTVERLFVDVDLADPIVAPGGKIRGSVLVTTPSGTPVAGASVVVTGTGIETQQLRTGDDGKAALDFSAPAYLAGDLEERAIGVRVEHPAHGALHTAAPFMLSRVTWRVLASAEAGGLVPRVGTEAFLSVTDARGEPPPEGTVLSIEGPGVRGTVRATTDAHGLVAVPLTVEPGDYGQVAAPSPCAGKEAVQIEVTVQTNPPAFSEVCVPVAGEATLLVRPTEPFASPGGEVAFSIERPAGARGDVIVEALLGDRLLASTRARGARGSLTLPDSVGGVVELRARPITSVDQTAPLDERGLVAHGVGGSAAVVVRPPDAFSLALQPNQNPYMVRDEAAITATTSQPSPQAWIAFVARDLAAHGGESPWSLEWLGASLDRALVAPTEGDAVLVRASLAALVERDFGTHRPQPLVTPPWGLPTEGPTRGRPEVLRDPLRTRAELIRRGAAHAMLRLEHTVQQRVGNREELEKLLTKRGNRWAFRDDAPTIAHLGAHNLGGEAMTVAMLKSADSGFSFDTVGERIARTQLVRLLVALRRLSNPDDQNAARAVAGQPPERWLSRLVELGTLPREALIDPWGNPFTFRRTTRPALVFSAQAAEWELSSPGPDGRAGTGDDIKDPFARILTEGTPYAVVSGEDSLMHRLSALAPGPATLVQMAQAYNAMSLEAAQERTRGPVSGAVSEQTVLGALGDQAGEMDGFAMAGGGGSGSGYGRGAGRLRARASASRAAPSDDALAGLDMEAEPMAEAEEMADEDARYDRNMQANAPAPPPSPLSAMSMRIRERFPATLHVQPGQRLEGTSSTLSFELADALTTYRVEAIAWTASGWTTTARTQVRVDQRATVDAPVPPFATVGDVVRLPVRVDNRTGEPLEVRVEIESEGVTIAADPIEPFSVPARRGQEVVVAVRVPQVGEGHVVVRAATTGGQPLDAVRRPLRVWEDARVVRRTIRSVVEGAGDVVIDIPSDATPRGAGQLRVVRGSGVFGALDEKGLEGGWAQAVLRERVPEPTLAMARRMLRAEDPRPELRIAFPPVHGALALAVVWNDDATEDVVLERALRVLSERTPTGESEGPLMMAADVLRALAGTHGRPGLREIRQELVDRLVEQLASTVRMDDVGVMASAASALALTEGSEAQGQARELLRRLAREEVRYDDQSFVERSQGRGTPEGRFRPTADVALAYGALGERERALRYVRNLLDLPLPAQAEASIAAVAAGRLGGDATGTIAVSLDGTSIDLSGDPPVRSASFPTPGAGEHTLSVRSEGVSLLLIELRYARPWDAAPEREARFEASIEGEVGARDVRAALRLNVRSRQPRLVRMPVAYVDLPSGAELDQPTREALEAVGAQPTMEGRTLRIELPSLAPGRQVRLPLPLRWSVGGTLRGLGVTVIDESEVADAIQPATVVPSRALELPDEGPEPEAPEAELPPDPSPPDPEPIPLLRRLAPVAALSFRSEVAA